MYDMGNSFSYKLEDIICNPALIFTGKKYRISILSERLVRLEYNSKGVFENRKTSLVTNRKFDSFTVSVRDEELTLEIKTKYFRLIYLKEKQFAGTALSPSANLKIDLLNTNKYWFFNSPEAKNFLGSSTNLEDIKKGISYEKGLYSIDGFASIDDSKNYVIEEKGMIIERNENIVDTYVFLYNEDFKLCLKDYFKLTGNPPLIPRYSLGLWWSRDHQYNEDLIEKLVENFLKKEIPISVLILDKKWQTLVDGGGNNLTNSFRWNNNLFKSPQNFSNYLHEKKIHLGLNISPDYGVSAIEEHFEKFKNHLGWADNKTIPFGILNPKFLDAYLKLIIHPLENSGADFFFIDTKSNNKKFLWPLSHYNYMDNNRIQSKRGLILCKNSNIASHRYPVLYSGRTRASWDTLHALPNFNSTSANVGLSWWSHDIAGHKDGIEEEELYLRYAQLGTYSPIFRFHAAASKYYKREPWRWSVQTYQIVKDYINLRYRLIPYIYTEGYKYSVNAEPLIQPLYYKNKEIYDEPQFENQYYFGSELLVAPITTKKNPLINRLIQKIYLPEGTWYEFISGKKYTGNNRYFSFFKDEDYPVYAKSGAIIPMNVLNEINDTDLPKNLEIQVFPGSNNRYEMFEDDGISNNYKDGYFLSTLIDYKYYTNSYILNIKAIRGKTGIVPPVRDYLIRFRNTKKPDNVVVTYNETQLDGTAYADGLDFIVEIKGVPTTGELKVTCTGDSLEINIMKLINEDIDSIIYDLSVETEKKELIAAIMFGDLPLKKKRIALRKLKKEGLQSKFIQIFLKLLEYVDQL